MFLLLRYQLRYSIQQKWLLRVEIMFVLFTGVVVITILPVTGYQDFNVRRCASVVR